MRNDPQPSDSTEIINECKDQRLCCRSCGRYLFYVNDAVSFDIQIKCPRCGKITRILVGVNIQIDP